MKKRSVLPFVAAAAALGSGVATASAEAASLDVDFVGCRDIASITTAPEDNVRDKVSNRYQLVKTGGQANVIVRAALCQDLLVDGTRIGSGAVAQIGANIESPDGTGDINNATLEYVTDNRRLADALSGAGVPARVAALQGRFTLTSPTSATGLFDVPSPAQYRYGVSGSVTEPTNAPIRYQANWWTSGSRPVVMKTVVPNLRFGSASTQLTTPAGGALATLLGRTQTSFAVLDSYNDIPTAHMTVQPG